MRFLVTGATGFVGRAVSYRLLERGDDVHVLARNVFQASALREAGARVFEGGVGDPNEVAEAAKGCDVVVHAAAVSSHRAAKRALDWVNIAGTENVLNAARHVGCRRMVFISCGDVTICNQDRVQWNETRRPLGPPLDAHARSKLMAEELVITTSDDVLGTVALRPGVLWGPGDTTTLPQLCREARDGGVPLYGNGENLVTTCYIDHMVDAVLLASEIEAAASRTYYVTDGNFADAQEFYGALCEAAGLPAPKTGPFYGLAYGLAWLRKRVGGQGPWPTDVVHRGRSVCLDHSRAVGELGYEPRVSFDDGMRAVAEWVKQVGGCEAVAKMGRAPATADTVDEQVAAAGGDG